MRCIDADKLYPDCLTKEGTLAISQSQIANAPTVEPPEWQIEFFKRMVEEVRPKGEWARHDEWVGGEYVGGFYHVNCLCEDGYYSKWETNFCPNCGARMIKEGENDG